MKASLQLIPEQPAQELLAAAQAADELGFYACYSADEIYHKDAWLLLVAAAGRTGKDPSRSVCRPCLHGQPDACRSACRHA